MDKTSKKVTKDPKRQERGKKSHETYMKRLKEKIMEDNQVARPSTSSSTGDPTTSTPCHATRSNDTYVYNVGILAVLAIGVCVFILRLKIKNKSMSKKRINHRQNDVICFRKIYTINE